MDRKQTTDHVGCILLKPTEKFDQGWSSMKMSKEREGFKLLKKKESFDYEW